jgi:hypothetical protein
MGKTYDNNEANTVQQGLRGKALVAYANKYLPRESSTLSHGLHGDCESVQRLYRKDSPQRGFAALHCDVEDWHGIGVQ